MSVNAKLVKELREKTGAGMMDCKQALVESSGDMEKAVDFYADKNDTLVLISSSGKSKNMINACKAAKRKKIKVISFTGHTKNNPLSKITHLSLWINSRAYNFIENMHQIWLLTVCDLIIGKREYPAKKKN